MTADVSKVSNKYVCEICNYKCSKNSLWLKHLNTSKHKKAGQCLPKISKKIYTCQCGKEYSYKQSIFVHRKKCEILKNNQLETPIEPVMNANIILELLKQNQEFKELLIEQNNKILELSQNANGTQITNSNNNNTINNKFNLNFFLNEQCKDAMNIMDFANSLEIGLEDLEAVGNLGYATGIGNIIVRGLKELDVYKRPIHCSDSKRENLHVKDQGVWEQDKDRSLVTTAIRRVAKKNMMKITDWKEANPEYIDYNSKSSDTYMKLLIEATGPTTEEEKEKDFGKIIRKVAKEVTIDK